MCNKKKKEKSEKKGDFSSHSVFCFGRYPCVSLISAFFLFRVLLRRIEEKKQTVAKRLQVCYNNYNVFVRLVSFTDRKSNRRFDLPSGRSDRQELSYRKSD